MFVGRGKNTVLFPSLWGPEDWGLQRSGEGKARPAEALPDGMWPGFSLSLPGSLWSLLELGREWHMRQPRGVRIAALPALPAQGQGQLLLGVASSSHCSLPCGVRCGGAFYRKKRHRSNAARRENLKHNYEETGGLG